MKQLFAATASESDPIFKQFVDNPGVFKKIVTDSNVVAQEAGIGSLVSILEFGGSSVAIKLRGIVPSLVEKSLGSTRAGTKQKSVEALLWFIESDVPDPIIEDMVPFLAHRMPKLVAGTAAAYTEIFRTFGAKTVSPKPVLKAIPKLFAHTDKTVRTEATNLVVELYKWLGDPLKPLILPDLKPVQQKELEEEFSKITEPPAKLRYLKSEQLTQQSTSSAAGPNAVSGTAANEDEDDSVLDLAEPVNIFNKVPRDLSDRLASSKWKDRKEVLDELYSAVNVPRIVPNDDINEIIRLLAKCMKDANIQVVVLAANCVQSLANGLRSGFSRYHSIILSPILERLKEKKASVSEGLGSALDAIYKSCGLSEILEQVVEYLKHKTPQVKIEAGKFLARCLRSTKVMPKGPEIKSIADASVKLLNDTQEPVRTVGAEILGVTMKIVGERAMNPYLDSADDIKRAKIKEYYDLAEVKAKPQQQQAQTAAASKPPQQTSRPVSTGLLRKQQASSAASTSKFRTESVLSRAALPKQSRMQIPNKRPISSVSPVKVREEPNVRPALSGRGLTGRVSTYKLLVY